MASQRALLPDDDPRKWVYAEHTRIKHTLLQKYVTGWLRIVGSWARRVCLIDGFAGRGEHVDPKTMQPIADSGSPVLLVKAANNLLPGSKALTEVVCAFIEGDQSNYENLCTVLDRELPKYPRVNVLPPWYGLFAETIDEAVEKTGARSRDSTASFFFVDPFGYSHTPLQVMRRVLAVPKTELVMTFMAKDINRFLSSEKHRSSFEELFGDEYHQVTSSLTALVESTFGVRVPPTFPNADEAALVHYYVSRLLEGMDESYPSAFRMCEDEKSATLFYLVHVTFHPKGRWLMKETMFNVSGAVAYGYLGPRDFHAKHQMKMTFAEDETVDTLASMLVQKFSGRSLSFTDLQYESCMETNLVQKHYREAVKLLRETGQVEYQAGPRGGIAFDTIISFA